MIDAERVRACLAEVGRPDLARRIGTNRAGWAMIGSGSRHYLPDTDLHLIWRALCLSRGRQWADAAPEVSTPEQFEAFCRASGTDTTPTRHWCPVHNEWLGHFHRQCWEPER